MRVRKLFRDPVGRVGHVRSGSSPSGPLSTPLDREGFAVQPVADTGGAMAALGTSAVDARDRHDDEALSEAADALSIALDRLEQ